MTRLRLCCIGIALAAICAISGCSTTNNPGHIRDIVRKSNYTAEEILRFADFDDRKCVDLCDYKKIKIQLTEDYSATEEDRKRADIKNLILEELVRESEIEIPEKEMNKKVEEYITDAREEAAESGIPYQEYLMQTFHCSTENELRNYAKEHLLDEGKKDLVLGAVMRKKGLCVKNSEFEEHVKGIAEAYGYVDLEKFMADYGGRSKFLMDYAEDQVLERLAESIS